MGASFFVSYSRADAAGVAPDLADRFAAGVPSYRFWVDVRDIAPGADWDDQIDDAIRGCAALLFVMTLDSVGRESGWKAEWAWALKYKKPVIPLRFDPGAGLPFRLSSREYIDFTDFDRGVAQLRLFLGGLGAPEWELRELRFRLAEAQRELPRAVDPAQRARVEQDVADLGQRIAELEAVTADPVAADAQAEVRIATGLEGVRAPARPVPVMAARAKFVNPPPLTAPTYFQDRHTETGLLAGSWPSRMCGW